MRFFILLLIASLTVFSCKKQEASTFMTDSENNSNVINSASSHRDCSISAVRTFLQDKMSTKDYTSLHFDSVMFYQIDKGRRLVYKISSGTSNSETDFVLVATNPQHSVFKGNIIHIEPDPRWNPESGSFDGDVTFQSLGRDTTEIMNIVDGDRTNLRENSTLVVPSLPPGNILPEVIISTTIPSHGSGINFTMWMNLLSWSGAGVNSPVSSIFTETGGGGGGGGNAGVYGPISGLPSPVIGTPPTGSELPACGAIPAPVHVIGINHPPFDLEHPFTDIDYPYNAPQNEEINNGVDIQQTGVPSQQPSRLLGFSMRTPPNTEDMEHGFNGDPNGIHPSFLSGMPDNSLFYYMNSLFWACTIFDDDLKKVGDEMIDKFRNRTGGSYSNDVLNERVTHSADFRNYLKRFGGELRRKLIEANHDISSVLPIDMEGDRPHFSTPYDKFHGLQILINDTETTTIELTGSTYLGNGNWEVSVSVTIIDHFGLDRNDALTYQLYHSGFPSWWLLQNTRDYVPFQTIIKTNWQLKF